MSNQVYANNMEVSCKQAAGKSICAFPDVCYTPPQTPATPPGVPIPYPNTGMASDTSDGSSSVMISGQEVMLKNKSYFKTSTGDEAGAAPMKGVVTHKNTGKVYFNAWSMDVKVEGENLVRHLDLTTHNHGSNTNTPPVPFSDRMTVINDAAGACKKEIREIERACGKPKAGEEPVRHRCPKGQEDALDELDKEKESIAAAKKKQSAAFKARYKKAIEEYSKALDGNACQKALRCALVPYGSGTTKYNYCCEHQTPDHLILGSSFFKNKAAGTSFNKACESYDYASAPCMCAEGGATQGTHGLLGNHRNQWQKDNRAKLKPWTVAKAAECGAHAAKQVSPHCSSKCIEEQLIQQHKKMNIDAETPIRRMNDKHSDTTVAALKQFGAGRA